MKSVENKEDTFFFIVASKLHKKEAKGGYYEKLYD